MLWNKGKIIEKNHRKKNLTCYIKAICLQRSIDWYASKSFFPTCLHTLVHSILSFSPFPAVTNVLIYLTAITFRNSYWDTD